MAIMEINLEKGFNCELGPYYAPMYLSPWFLGKRMSSRGWFTGQPSNNKLCFHKEVFRKNPFTKLEDV